jgi:hypothetical protein
MAWQVDFDPEFKREFDALPAATQDSILTGVGMLALRGPALPRPWCDTLGGSRHANMKELRFKLPTGAWRVAFAFDPRRRAILLVAGSKSGITEALFYRRLIALADSRFDRHLARLGQGD